MSRPESAALLSLAESIADGAAIDWDAAEAAASERDRVLIGQLRVLSDLAGLHRSLPAVAGERRGNAAARHALAAPAIGSWAHLALIERLGGGTFGDVYRAWDRHLERDVALKLLRADESTDDLHASRIAREGRLLARVRHANVITVHGVDAHDGRVGLWMELVRGVTLEQQIAARGPLSAREAAADRHRFVPRAGRDSRRRADPSRRQGAERHARRRRAHRADGFGHGARDGRRRERPVAAISPARRSTWRRRSSAARRRASARTCTASACCCITSSPAASRCAPPRSRNCRRVTSTGSACALRDARADLPTAFVRVIDRAIAADPEQRTRPPARSRPISSRRLVTPPRRLSGFANAKNHATPPGARS